MFKRIAISVTIVLLALMTWGWFNIWRSPAYYQSEGACLENENVLTMAEYGDVMDEHTRPYVVRTADVTVFGAEHTRDPEDVQIESIKSEWKRSRPTTALVEGRLGFLIPYVMNPVEEFGESGLVAALSRSDGVGLYSWELPKSDLILRLVETYTPEQVALSQVLTPYFSSYRFGPPENPDQFAGQFLSRARYPGLDNAISSVADIDSIWRRDFANVPDWRETSDQYGLPGYLADIGATANLIRNRHLLCTINDLRSQGERVFVICGLSHAVCIEPALVDE